MNWLVTVLLGNTVVALGLAAAALAASLLRRPAAAHVLWALVIVKLITPAAVRVGVPGWGAEGTTAGTLAAEAASPLAEGGAPAIDVRVRCHAWIGSALFALAPSGGARYAPGDEIFRRSAGRREDRIRHL